MLQYYRLTDDGRVCFTSDSPYTVVDAAGEVITEGEQFDFPEDFDFLEQHNYKIIDGELVYEPASETEETPEPEASDTPDGDDLTADEMAAAILEGVNEV